MSQREGPIITIHSPPTPPEMPHEGEFEIWLQLRSNHGDILLSHGIFKHCWTAAIEAERRSVMKPSGPVLQGRILSDGEQSC